MKIINYCIIFICINILSTTFLYPGTTYQGRHLPDPQYVLLDMGRANALIQMIKNTPDEHAATNQQNIPTSIPATEQTFLYNKLIHSLQSYYYKLCINYTKICNYISSRLPSCADLTLYYN